MVIKETKEMRKPLVTQEDIEKRYPWADDIDRAIINSIINAPKSMSIYVFKTKFEKSINFWERVDKILDKCPELKRWEAEKITLQIGTKEQYDKAKEDPADE